MPHRLRLSTQMGRNPCPNLCILLFLTWLGRRQCSHPCLHGMTTRHRTSGHTQFSCRRPSTKALQELTSSRLEISGRCTDSVTNV